MKGKTNGTNEVNTKISRKLNFNRSYINPQNQHNSYKFLKDKPSHTKLETIHINYFLKRI